MSNLENGMSTLGRYLVALIMSFFVTLSVTAIFTMACPPGPAGYEAAVLESEDSEEVVDSYVHYYSDGEDTKLAGYEAQGYYINTREFSGALSGPPYVAAHTVSQIIGLVFFVMIVPHKLNALGSSDKNRVDCGRMEEDVMRGLKIGSVTAGVQLVTWVCLVLDKVGVFVYGSEIFTYANYHCFGYLQLIFGQAKTVAEIGWLSIVAALLPAAITLFVCWLSYYMGYNQVRLSEKILYKNKEK